MAQLYAIYMYKETHFQYNNKGRMKIKWWEKIYHTNINLKKVGVAIFIWGISLQHKDCYRGQSGTLFNDKRGVNAIIIHSNPKGQRTKQQNCQVHEMKTCRTAKKKFTNPVIFGDNCKEIKNICINLLGLP